MKTCPETTSPSERPLVTVLLPVHNGRDYLQDAIASVLRQTLTDFELLVIDDGSTDGSVDLIRAYDDPRIRLVVQEQNRGVADTLNHGLSLARGEFIARMDADDICRPERLERQVDLLRRCPDVAVCGSWVEAFEGAHREVWEAPVTHDAILARMLFVSALYHPTACFRSAFMTDNSLQYASDFPCAQDYDLWARCAAKGRLANLAEVLLEYRLHPGQSARQKSAVRQDYADRVRFGLLSGLGLHPDEPTLALHRALSLGEPVDMQAFDSAERWLLSIRDGNSRAGWISDQAMAGELATRWLHLCLNAGSHRGVLHRFVRSPFFADVDKRWRVLLSMTLRRIMSRFR